MDRAIAFVANGSLHLKPAGGEARPVESPFADEMRGRAQEIHRRHAWKAEGRGAMFMSRSLFWGAPARDPSLLTIAVTSLSRGTRAGELLYAMNAEGRSAVCRLRLEDGVERRLLHGFEQPIQDLCAFPGRDEIACSLQHKDGTAGVAVMTAEATDIAEITEGEVRDASPCWAPGPGRRLYYASAGVGRDARGRHAGLGLSAIHSVDLARGVVETVVSDARRDLLAPRVATDGALYYVSRPRAAASRPAVWRAATDALLLPLRLLYAVFQYLSFFTAKYTGRPLTTAGGPEQRGTDLRRMQVWSNLIEAEQASGDDAVPESLRSSLLVRRSADGRSETLAEGVLSFDLDPGTGEIVYSTGNAVHRLAPDGSRQKLLSQAAVTHVVFAD